MERRALGKGIGALIPEKETVVSSSIPIVYLDVNLIKPNPYQPREQFDEDGLENLKQSIKEKGVIQPVLVRKKGDQYELIAGERRLRAAVALAIKEIPAIVKNIEDQDSLEISLIENIQRQDLNPIEEARAIQYLIEKFNLTQERVSEVLGKARVTITNILRLLRLPQEIQEDIRRNRISFAHGRALLEIEDVNHQRRLVHEIISKSLTVAELENLIKGQRPKVGRLKINPRNKETIVAVLEEELQQILATKVKIVKQKKRGRVVIEFYSQTDLERIVAKIRGEVKL